MNYALMSPDEIMDEVKRVERRAAGGRTFVAVGVLSVSIALAIAVFVLKSRINALELRLDVIEQTETNQSNQP